MPALTADIVPTILCVDDEPIVLTSLREQFELHLDGYEVEVAQDAAEALEILDELSAAGRRVPLVISDHIMPGMKGDELLVRVHERLPDTRTILLTGQAGLDAVGRAVNNAGLYRYITKPWNRDDLTMTVREAVRSYLSEQQVREQQARLVAAHRAAMRFVPSEFLALFGRRELAEVRLGDCVAEPVSVYYSDIRSFTTLVETHTPAENLSWINEYLRYMERPIRRHGGFIEGIAGDAILALFGTGADAVVRAAIGSLAALEECNAVRARRGEIPLRIGIGMTTGPCLMGVIGGEDTLKCGVIGDVVNLAARVEGLTKHLGTLLLTEQTRSALVDPGRYAMRYVDRVRVKGLAAPTTLWEVLDGLPEAERARKMATADRLAEALGLFQARDLDGAASLLDELLRVDPEDAALRWHRSRTTEAARRGLPADWDGTSRLEMK
jgi:adenylate cyclase